MDEGVGGGVDRGRFSAPPCLRLADWGCHVDVHGAHTSTTTTTALCSFLVLSLMLSEQYKPVGNVPVIQRPSHQRHAWPW